ncbi:MAG: hypothetical protein A2428_04180 [Bdellovibrionales bacterium RIFOXYC1_FULL_54_43]|nr:MAG: hypothetical protein A2428_04180 [Bdellovibrionales bacterium RIFOXYC1_FULL_54_43]OFZ82947.1 MAG: hypothetical protein A2603_11005 [Bdellovibrionales bacterium RIFOXYD1_FULL_55_31]
MTKTSVWFLVVGFAFAVAGTGCQKLNELIQAQQARDNGSLEHTKEFMQTGAHGAPYLAGAGKSCFTCHQASEADETTARNPKDRVAKPVAASSCSSCHGTFPHNKEFMKSGAVHGGAFLGAVDERRNSAKCLTCHKNPDTRAVAPPVGQPRSKIPSCSSSKCHDSFPHIQGFGNQETHGAAYLKSKESRRDCIVCHRQRETVPGRALALPACTSCHQEFPHSDGFASPEDHGYKFIDDSSRCTGCHSSGGESRGVTSCADCHLRMPHPEGFGDSQVHGPESKSIGTKTCLNCHSENHRTPGGKIVPACAYCHASYPHSAEYGNPERHGLDYLKIPESCLGCHAGSGVEKPGCSDCHIGVPHTPELTKKHGSAYLSKPGDCAGCHIRGIASEVPGAKVLPTCKSCHVSYPHPDGFGSRAAHGPAYFENRAKCADCHKPGANPVILACADCHDGFPHEENFKSPESHGQAYLENSGSCTGCHGETLAGQGRAGACATCHSRAHSDEFKTTRLHGKLYVEDRGTKECMGCHDTSKPGTSPKGIRSCAICHKNYPHAEGFRASENHGKAYFENPSDCAVCHGADFAGRGNSISCRDCHAFPHVKPWGLPEQHGAAFDPKHDPANPSEPDSSCRGCHYKDSDMKKQFPDRYISCGTCHFWHLEKGANDSIPKDIPPKWYHAWNSRQPKNKCTSCHTDGKKLLPWKDGCRVCHRKGEMVIRFRNASVELGPPLNRTFGTNDSPRWRAERRGIAEARPGVNPGAGAQIPKKLGPKLGRGNIGWW